MNRETKRLRFLILALAAFMLTASVARADEERSLLVGGVQQRNYRIHLPPNPASPRPVVIALHGMLQSADGMDSYLGLNLVADRENFTVVYPYGLGNSWKDGRYPALRMTFWAPPGDDVEFLSELVQKLVEQGI